MEVVFVLKTPEMPAVECILCAPLARKRVAAEAGQGERGTHQNMVGALRARGGGGRAAPRRPLGAGGEVKAAE